VVTTIAATSFRLTEAETLSFVDKRARDRNTERTTGADGREVIRSRITAQQWRGLQTPPQP